LILSNQAVLSVHDELSATGRASMVLFATVNVAIFLEALGSALWTRASYDHSYPLASLVSSGNSRSQYHGIVSRTLPV
jgi:hypothetical protein